MAAFKRKQNTIPDRLTGRVQKKPRNDEEKTAETARISNRLQTLETVTDSDPIVESDTTSQSGEDDGVSWPSDDQGESAEEGGVVPMGEDSDTAGVAIAVGKMAAKATHTNSTPTGA